MAQLSDDCFAFGGPMMSLDEARRLIGERLSAVVGIETVSLAEADGRILAEDVFAPLPLPPFDNSAVDGYAVRFDDLDHGGETTLPIRGRLAAGASPEARPNLRSAIRIFTGAPMPQDCDTVFMQEDVRVEKGAVILPPGLERGANRRPAGEDLGQGVKALGAGRRLGPGGVALLASLGLAAVEVRTRLRVAVFSTGDELVSPGAPRGGAKLYDANRFMLLALLRRLGCAGSDLGILPDDGASVARAFAAAAKDHDLIITSGGVSTGEEDHVKAAVESAGSLTFWRLGIKPGRPVAMGMASGTPLMGLPGNPAAAFVTFVQVARAAIARLSGEDFVPPTPFGVTAGFAYRKKEGRREYVRVRLVRIGDGGIEARKHPREGAGVITSLTETDGLVELPEAVTRVEPGQTVAFLPYAALV